MSRTWRTLLQRLYTRESVAGHHDLFCPPELVRAQILLALESRGPCDIRTLEASTNVAPKYLLEEVFNYRHRGASQIGTLYTPAVGEAHRKLSALLPGELRMSAGFLQHVADLFVWASFVCGFMGIAVGLPVKTLISHSDEPADDASEAISSRGEDGP